MKFSTAFLVAGLAALSSAIAIPRGTSGAIVQIPGKSDFRIYNQDTNSFIKETSVGLPTSKPMNTGVIYTGGTRTNTPLAALIYSIADPNFPEIRVYYITPRNTLGEVAFFKGAWNKGSDLGFTVQTDSQNLYATRAGSTIVVGYTDIDGNLAEAYYDTALPGWKSYVL